MNRLVGSDMECPGALLGQAYRKLLALLSLSLWTGYHYLYSTKTHLFEVGQHVLPAPAGVSQCFPSIIISSGTSGSDDAIENTSPTDHMPLPVVPRVIIEKLLRCRGEIPVVGWGKSVADQSWDRDNIRRGVPAKC
jgi:hypothetical protein